MITGVVDESEEILVLDIVANSDREITMPGCSVKDSSEGRGIIALIFMFGRFAAEAMEERCLVNTLAGNGFHVTSVTAGTLGSSILSTFEDDNRVGCGSPAKDKGPGSEFCFMDDTIDILRFDKSVSQAWWVEDGEITVREYVDDGDGVGCWLMLRERYNDDMYVWVRPAKELYGNREVIGCREGDSADLKPMGRSAIDEESSSR